MRTIPLINISSSNDIVREIETACREIGFMYVVGHGIPSNLIADVRATVIEYFSLPREVKDGHRISQDNYRGYIPAGFFSPNSGAGAADNYEGYKLHYETDPNDPIVASCDLYGPNRWPDAPKHLKRYVLSYWRECDRVAAVLLNALANALDIDRSEFLQLFEKPLTNMTLLHYPKQSPGSGGFGIHPHKDTDALTILAPDPVGGLMVRCRDEQEWINAAPRGDALIVNIGDLLELWSGGYFVSTPHKVVNTSGVERYSFPYFAVPRYDTIVKPLRTPITGFHRPNVHVGDVSREVWRTNWPDATPYDSHIDLGTLED